MVRGTAQNPDVFFQAREAGNRFHDAVPGIVADVFAELEARTGRRYGLVDYEGAPDAERVIVMMGSGAGAVGETVAKLVADGEKVGLATIRLFRPFPIDALLDALPDTVRSIAVLDRCKEPGSVGEPLFQDVVTADRRVRSHAAFAIDRWPLRPRLEGVHPGDGQGGVRRTRRSTHPSVASPSASSTMSPT